MARVLTEKCDLWLRVTAVTPVECRPDCAAEEIARHSA
jgi:hypothetical protein